jgi:hypothetical protein
MRRLASITAAVLLAVGLAGLAAPGARASVPEAFCNGGNGLGSCANRQAGGTGTGTPVILYNRDFDNNEDFAPANITHMCGNGLVTQSCPFADPTIDERYFGDQIVQILAYNHSGCIGIGAGSVTAQLQPCNNQNGSGGGSGTILVVSGSNYYIDRGLTNQDNGVRFMCGGGFGNPINMDSASGIAGTCQWTEPLG